MGLIQQALKTYDVMERIGEVGKYKADDKYEPLAPMGHMVTKAQIEITIDEKGDFISAARLDDKKIIIPVTEASSGRSSNLAPHPLCEQVKYLTGDEGDKYEAYLAQLKDWMDSKYTDQQIVAVYKYVEKGTVKIDLSKADLIKKDTDFVCWRIVNLGTVYEDCKLHDKYRDYYCSKNQRIEEIDFVTGQYTFPAEQHLKGIVSKNGNAKIISANDPVNFTYRGRFEDGKQALTIGYSTSQKAHNVLKWLVANQGKLYGSRAFVCWNPNGIEVPLVYSPLLLFDEDEYLMPSDYKKKLGKCLEGYTSEIGNEEDVIIASFDAATPGRLSVTYYNELKALDFIERLKYWDETCCWFNGKYGVGAPRLYDIVLYSYGEQRGSDESAYMDIDDRIKSQYMQRIVKDRVNKCRIQYDIVRQLINKVNNMQIYSRKIRSRLLFITCAVIRKYQIDARKEEWDMALDETKKDRSYQYGRLLAVLEKIERDTYDREEKRETNAIRMQSVFVKRPGYATKIIMEQLKNSYFPRLSTGARAFYDKIIGQIMEVISQFEDNDFNKPLDETYLLGYYLQRNSLYTRKEDSEEREVEEYE